MARSRAAVTEMADPSEIPDAAIGGEPEEDKSLSDLLGEEYRGEDNDFEGEEGDENTPADDDNPPDPGAGKLGAAAAVREKAKETPPADDPDAEELKAYAQFGRSFEQGFTQNPVATIERLIANLKQSSPGMAAELATRLGGSAPGSDPSAPARGFDIKNYSPGSDLEAALVPHFDSLVGMPKRFNDLEEQHGSAIESALEENLVLKERMAILEETLGYEPPKFDRRELDKYLRSNPNATPEDAIRATYGKTYRSALEIAKQKSAERPRTMRNGSGGKTPSSKKASDMSLRDWWQAYPDED